MQHWVNVFLWQNYGVGNFTAAAVVGVGGFFLGRRSYKKHIHPVLRKVHEIHAHIYGPTE